MAVYGLRSRKEPAEIVAQAKDYFAGRGLGFTISDENPFCLVFSGGGGHVTVRVAEGGAGTEIDLETLELDYHVKRFIERI